ncbi:MAG: TlpA family protein disulfide reductase [Leptospirales bacterium]|nr:TlpA family protein disulfide reductase [Leptospirales bacterium]
MLRPAGLFSLLFLALAAAQCRPAAHSAFGVGSWQGRSPEGRILRLAELQTPALILNFYSPTCAPCIAELPALNALYREARSRGAKMFLAVELDPEEFQIALAPAASEEERFQAVVARLRQDVVRYHIEPPILIMDPDFRIDPSSGLITGTPETLFFRTAPLRLDYNFIGPITTARDGATIAADTRYQFAVRALTRVLSAASPSSEAYSSAM